VADELPDRFIAQLRQAADEVSGDSLLLGEVWEDGTTKIAYDERRRYLLGGEFHGLMNYPFRTSLIDYLLQGQSYIFFDAMETIRENYPPAHFYASMNFLGTHDTARILTVLGASEPPKEKADRAEYVLSDAERKLGMARLRMASLILYTFPGSPTVYYGDEAGLEGFEDPFNRKPYPWGNEDTDLLRWYTKLGKIRKRHPALRRGELQWLAVDGPVLAYRRTDPTEHLVVVTNAADTPQELTIPWEPLRAYDLLSHKKFFSWNGQLTVTIPAHGCFLLI
jgi:4-alpha-glucanotransferase